MGCPDGSALLSMAEKNCTWRVGAKRRGRELDPVRIEVGVSPHSDHTRLLRKVVVAAEAE
jgi:hypothetical protein